MGQRELYRDFIQNRPLKYSRAADKTRLKRASVEFQYIITLPDKHQVSINGVTLRKSKPETRLDSNQ